MKIYFLLPLLIGIGLGYVLFTPKDHDETAPKTSPLTHDSSLAPQRTPKIESKASPDIKKILAEANLAIDPVIPQDLPSLSITKSTNNSSNAVDSPWQQLQKLASGNLWMDVIAFCDQVDLGAHRSEAEQLRAFAIWNIVSQSKKTMSPGRKIELLKDQLIRTPEAIALHQLLAQTLYEKGSVADALSELEQTMLSSNSEPEREILLQERESMVQNHLDFLSENKYWTEIINFVGSNPAPGSANYYGYQLAAAQAHMQLYEWDKANLLLDIVEYDPELYSISQKLRADILELKKKQFEKNQVETAVPNVRDTLVHVDEKGYTTIPFEKAGHSIIVKFLIGRNELHLVLDTGASLTMISNAWAQKTRVHQVAQLGDRFFITAGGRVKVPLAQFCDCTFGDFKLNDIEMAFQDIFPSSSNIDGLLGMNILKFFEFNIDFEASLLRIKAKY